MGTNFTDADLSPCWTKTMHRSQGNVLLADGSVQQFSSRRLREQLRGTGDTNASANANFLLFP